ncbi:MAG: allantoicase [Polyangiaceae bacterium]
MEATATGRAPQAFEDLVELSREKYGASVLYATDDFFAEKENLLRPEKAIFIDGKYTDRGKWMDGWESRRKRTPGHDFAIIRLGLPGVVRGVVVDTAFFKGNYPQACSIEGVSLPAHASVEELLREDLAWTELLPRSDLAGDAENPFEITGAGAADRVTHLRLHIYPDGGVARLRVYGDVTPSTRFLGRPGTTQEVDFAAVENGAVVLSCNDMFFGSRHNLISPGRAINMGDGWETKRSRRPGPDWVILKLAAQANLHRAIVDTLHFKGNFPESCALFGIDVKPGEAPPGPDSAWNEILPRTKLSAHTLHDFEAEVAAVGPVTHVMMRIWPDGGVSRLRLLGEVTEEGATTVGLRYLNALSLASRTELLRTACASSRFAAQLAAEVPFTSFQSLAEKARKVWFSLTPKDWDEAFAAHPRIGARKGGAREMKEQAGMSRASEDLRYAMEELNRDYESKFGRIYLVCASGKTAEELVTIARGRMDNTPEAELKVAAEEQAKITELRLSKIVRNR